MREHDELSVLIPGVHPERRQAERDLRRRQRRRRRGRRSLILLVALAVVAGGGYVAFTALRPMVDSLRASNDYAGGGSGRVDSA